MLPKKFRITGKPDFQKVLKNGRFFQGILANVATYKGESVTRFGIIISSKVSKLATERNRLKRIIRRFIQENIKTLQKGLLVVILVKRTAIEKEKDEITKELVRLFKKAEILK